MSILLCMFFTSILRADVLGERYEFTDQSGRKLEANILKCNPKEVEVERVSDGRRFTLALATLSEKDQRYFKEAYATVVKESPQQADSLTPGQIITLDFPELGAMAKGQPAQCQLSVPKHYDPIRPTPLLVWFSGGSGSHSVKGAQGLVDFDEFLVLALPYPKGRLPRLAVDAGDDEIDTFWEFQRPMLERVIEMVPNISEDVRIAGGASSGAHLVGSALDQKWRGFCDYFTGYILHEGGTSQEMKYSGTRSGHRILIIYGENSTAREWQDYFMERFDNARGRIEYIEVPNAGHGLNGEGKKRIREWIEKSFQVRADGDRLTMSVPASLWLKRDLSEVKRFDSIRVRVIGDRLEALNERLNNEEFTSYRFKRRLSEVKRFVNMRWISAFKRSYHLCTTG